MRGAIIGDIVGSRREGAAACAPDFELFEPGARFTDDTVCTVAVADALLGGEPVAVVLRRWCRRHPDAGFGGMFRRWVEDATLGPYGSWGNGAPMRISPVAWLVEDDATALRRADEISAVTHDHPDALLAARTVVEAIRLGRAGHDAAALRRQLRARSGYPLEARIAELHGRYGFDVTARGTAEVAILCALEAVDLEDAVRKAVSLGGDADTLGAIAGSIAEARFGVPEALWRTAAGHLTEEMLAVVERFDAACAGTAREALP
jgi:ADP-ribosylglycohydrolase